MASTKVTFSYTDTPDSICGPDDFILKVRSGIRLKADLLSTLEHVGCFPDYFGGNWDALLDCLRDFSWVRNKRIVVVHSDLPLHNDPAECLVYLDILDTALSDWSERIRTATAQTSPRDWPYIDHELLVIFPTAAKNVVDHLLARQRIR